MPRSELISAFSNSGRIIPGAVSYPGTMAFHGVPRAMSRQYITQRKSRQYRQCADPWPGRTSPNVNVSGTPERDNAGLHQNSIPYPETPSLPPAPLKFESPRERSRTVSAGRFLSRRTRNAHDNIAHFSILSSEWKHYADTMRA